MVKEKTIGVAFLGLGRMGETHLRNLATISGVKVVVIADPARERAERGRQMTGAELALTEPEKAIEHPSVDAVVIVTPTNTHARLIEVAANAGKAVFSEKPIALDLSETERIVQVTRERRVPLPQRAGAKSGRLRSRRSPHEPYVPTLLDRRISPTFKTPTKCGKYQLTSYD